jgi:uncharacterized membrane protein YvbJ
MTYGSNDAEYKQCPQCGKVQETRSEKCPLCGTRYAKAAPRYAALATDATSQSSTSFSQNPLSSSIIFILAFLILVFTFHFWRKADVHQIDIDPRLLAQDQQLI